MSTGRHPTASVLRTGTLIVLTLQCAVAAAGAEGRNVAPGSMARARAQYARGLSRYDSLTIAQDRSTATVVLDSLDAVAGRDGDGGLAALVAERRARALARDGRFGEARRELRFVLESALAQRDTLAMTRAYVDLGELQRKQLANRDAAASFHRAADLAKRAGLTSNLALAQLRLGYLRLYEGRAAAARQLFEAALRNSEAAHDDFRAVRARSGLARALHVEGRYEDARRMYLLVLEGARRRGEQAEEADTYSALGTLESDYGDPDVAADDFARALELHRALHVPDQVANDATRIAEHDLWRGAPAHADSVISGVLGEARGLAARQVYAGLLVTLAQARHLQEREHDAEMLVGRALALADSMQPLNAAEVAANGIEALLAARRYETAEALCDSVLARFAPRMPATVLDPLIFLRGVALHRSGRAREALPLLRASVETRAIAAGALNASRVARCAELARCYRTLGRVDDALFWYGAATDAWETGRAIASHEDSRAMSDNIAGAFSGGYIAALLDPTRGGTAARHAAEAFAVLQRFRAHVVGEQVHGPGRAGAAGAPRAIDLASLQRVTLRPGELLLELHATPDTTILFAVTRAEIRAWFAPREEVLRSRLARFRDLLADPEDDRTGRWRAPARALGTDLLAPAADLVSGAARVLVSAGGMARYPLGSIIAPGAGGMLAADREVAFVPAVAMLARTRERSREPAASADVVAVARTAGADGRTLPGAAQEVRDLSRTFANVTALLDPTQGATRLARERFGEAEVLHFATHTHHDEQQPWRSGLLIGDPAGADAYLRSATIASLRLKARLCVLSSCRGIGGAGAREAAPLEGLAPAWLAAGVPSVVAALWDVDDAVTAKLMRRFYDELARGLDVAAALAAVQREMAAQPPHSAPYFWAGFVVVGDPATRVRLTPRK